MEDAALVAAAVGGDKSAFAAIYDRYADDIHDFCWSVLRDRDEAADVMQDTFLIAARQLGTLRELSKVKSWLFAIARHEAIRRGKKLKRAVPTEGVGEEDVDRETSSEVEAGAGADRAEIQALVWAAAEGLSDRDRAILDLNLRQGLEGQDLADALGVSASQSYVLMSRLRDQVERSLGALLVARRGSDDCPELEVILRGWDGMFSPLLRKRVARHVERCEICTESRKSLVSPLAVFAATPALAAPAGLREKVLGRIELTSASRPPRGWQGDGFPPVDRASRRGPLLAAVAAIVVVLALAVSVAALGGGDERIEVAGGSESTTTTTSAPASSTASTSEATSSTTTVVPVADAHLVIGDALAMGEQASSGSVSLTNDGGRALTWTAATSESWLSISPQSGTLGPNRSVALGVTLDRAAAPEGEVAGSVTVDAGAAGTGTVAISAFVAPRPPVISGLSDGKACDSQAVVITADVQDESQLEVTLFYGKSSAPMTFDGKVWSATIGPLAGDVYFSVRAADVWGASADSPQYQMTVSPC